MSGTRTDSHIVTLVGPNFQSYTPVGTYTAAPTGPGENIRVDTHHRFRSLKFLGMVIKEAIETDETYLISAINYI